MTSSIEVLLKEYEDKKESLMQELNIVNSIIVLLKAINAIKQIGISKVRYTGLTNDILGLQPGEEYKAIKSPLSGYSWFVFTDHDSIESIELGSVADHFVEVSD